MAYETVLFHSFKCHNHYPTFIPTCICFYIHIGNERETIIIGKKISENKQKEMEENLQSRTFITVQNIIDFVCFFPACTILWSAMESQFHFIQYEQQEPDSLLSLLTEQQKQGNHRMNQQTLCCGGGNKCGGHMVSVFLYRYKGYMIN